MERGFTLVELSIVLVIIGLLIGGILVGQSLIESAKINAFISQLQQYDVAVTGFKGKYKSLPGDSKIFASVGDGDGLIENSQVDTATFSHSGRAQDYEIAAFWPQMQQSGMIKANSTTFTSDFSAGVKPGINAPKSTAGTSSTAFIIFASLSPRLNRYFVCDWSKNNNTSWDPSSQRTPAFKPAMALSIDSKIDDGLASSGMMVMDNWNNGTATTNSGRCFVSSGSNTFSVASNTEECCLMIQLLGTSAK